MMLNQTEFERPNPRHDALRFGKGNEGLRAFEEHPAVRSFHRHPFTIVAKVILVAVVVLIAVALVTNGKVL